MVFSDIITSLESCQDKFVHYFENKTEVCKLSFSELLQSSREILQQLKRCNVRKGMRVAIIGPNSVEWLKWDLALMELGCVVVSLPDEIVLEHGMGLVESLDLSLIVKDSNSSHTLFDNCPYFTTMDTKILNVVPRKVSGNSPFGVDDVCALTFSSGSSGRPKCLMINPRGIKWDIENYLPVYKPRADDRLLIFLPMTHQQQRLLVYASYKLKTSFIFVNPDQLTNALSHFHPSLCLAPPLFYDGIYERFIGAIEEMNPLIRHTLSAARWSLNRLPKIISNPLKRRLFKDIYSGLGGKMRLMITGMAPIKKPVLAFFNEIGIPLFEAYGLTETGVIAANVPGASRAGSVGKPVKGCKVTIGNDNEVLVLRNHQTTFGHIEMNGKSHPFDLNKPVPTGDIGQLDSEGYLYLMGRKKEIIITAQGHKIHPEFLESMLHEHESIAQAVVFGDGQKHLAAVIFVRHNLSDSLKSDLESFAVQLSERLSQSFPIGKVVFSNDIPSLGNGLLTRSLKINRPAIEARFSMALFDREKIIIAEPTDEELSEIDNKILAVVKTAWEDVLERSNLPLNANFFDLGGDSLSAMRIINSIQDELDVTVSLSDMVLQPSIYGCSYILTDRARDEAIVTYAHTEIEEGVL